MAIRDTVVLARAVTNLTDLISKALARANSRMILGSSDRVQSCNTAEGL